MHIRKTAKRVGLLLARLSDRGVLGAVRAVDDDQTLTARSWKSERDAHCWRSFFGGGVFVQRCNVFSVVQNRKLKRVQVRDEPPKVGIVEMRRNQGDDAGCTAIVFGRWRSRVLTWSEKRGVSSIGKRCCRCR
ncbi:predicted protein [Lichtheimia corymbifera JMRC:FSU:9682]|uniref:Uncharacterized protein n=1 Tax=Lichtheimia corymbifera JMRC:FSU:9682 TaxID=1263082 RepID=A0A068SAC9_9FUNG|nr:predicted protein [Lichtheimia corymbifera JMRC:FSU:9682]